MAEDFAKLLDREMATLARKSGFKPSVSPVAYALCNLMTHAFDRYTRHVTDCQQTAIKAYGKAAELEERLAALEGPE